MTHSFNTTVDIELSGRELQVECEVMVDSYYTPATFTDPQEGGEDIKEVSISHIYAGHDEIKLKSWEETRVYDLVHDKLSCDDNLSDKFEDAY